MTNFRVYDFDVEVLDSETCSITHRDALERSTGWKDCWVYDPETHALLFFDAEANVTYPSSAVRELAWVISAIEDRLDDERYTAHDDDYDNGIPSLTYANTGTTRFGR